MPKSRKNRCHCGQPLNEGYGLAGGGIGSYLYCAVHGVTSKTQDEDATVTDRLFDTDTPSGKVKDQ